MRNIIFLFVAIATAKAQTDQEYRAFLKKWEGKTNHVIFSEKERIVGIGHNLIGVSPVRDYYSNSEVEEFFRTDLIKAKRVAAKTFENFNDLDKNAKMVIISLIWCVGESGFGKFVKFIKAIKSNDYVAAARELKNSKWATQVGRARYENHYNLLLAAK